MRHILTSFLICILVGPVASQVSCNDFDVKSRVVGNSLELKVVSDLPDDALISVSATRRYWRKGNSKAYTFDYFAKEMEMKVLRKTNRFDLSEAVFKDVIRKASELSEMAGRGPIKVDRLDSDVKLRVSLTMNQKNEDFGEYNKNLQGRAVKQIDEYRGVKVFRRIPMTAAAREEQKPKPKQKKAPTFKAADFVDGGCYELREKFDLLSHYETGPEQKAVVVGKAMKRSIAYIHRRVEIGEHRWYRLAVMRHPDAKDVAFGWARAAEFGRKKHRQADDVAILRMLAERNWIVPADKNVKFKTRGKARVLSRFDSVRVVEGIIELPDGLSEEEAKSWAMRGVWDLFEREGAQAAIVKVAREGDDSADAGSAWILPGDVAEPELLQPKHFPEDTPLRLKGGASILPAYFKERPKSLPVGTEIFVKKEGSFEVHIYDQATWKEGEKAKTRVAKGTSGVVEKVRYLDAGGTTILRYFLKLEGGKTGWVKSEYVFKF